MVDICLVFDTTGSMSSKIDGLVACMVDFVNELSRLSLNWRISVVPFGDLTVRGDRVVSDLPFVSERGQAERTLRTMPRFSGGGNTGESSLEAMQAAMAKPYRREAVKVLVVLTDEPALESTQLTAKTISQVLNAREFICFVTSPNLPGYRDWARVSGGEWYQIAATTDTSALLQFLQRLMTDVARISNAVHNLAGGSVQRYRQIEPERRRRELGK